mgnify:CR=1 FL=1
MSPFILRHYKPSVPYILSNGPCAGFVITERLYRLAMTVPGYVHHQLPVGRCFQPVFVCNTPYTVGGNTVHVSYFLCGIGALYLRKGQ